MKTSTVALTLILFAPAVTAVVVLTQLRVQSPTVASSTQNDVVAPELPEELPTQTATVQPAPSTNAILATPPVVESPVERPTLSTNKLDRLAQIREAFRTLAAGDKLNAMRAAKQIAD